MNRDAVIGEWRRSQESLGAAETLMRSGYASDAVSRAYYAIMHAARSALFVHGVATASHIATRRMFGTQLVATGEIESGWADELAEGLDERLAADYDIYVQYTADAACQECSRARKFCERIQTYLVEKGVTDQELQGRAENG